MSLFFLESHQFLAQRVTGSLRSPGSEHDYTAVHTGHGRPESCTGVVAYTFNPRCRTTKEGHGTRDAGVDGRDKGWEPQVKSPWGNHGSMDGREGSVETDALESYGSVGTWV